MPDTLQIIVKIGAEEKKLTLSRQAVGLIFPNVRDHLIIQSIFRRITPVLFAIVRHVALEEHYERFIERHIDIEPPDTP